MTSTSTKKNEKLLTLSDPQTQLVIPPDNVVQVEISWTVKAFTGEVDLDSACLLFNKYGRFVETIFWDNLSSRGVRHYGDEAIKNADDDEDSKEEENAKEEEENEMIEIDFNKLDKSVTTLIFAINIFSNKTFSNVTNLSFKVISSAKNDILFRLSGQGLRDIRDYNSLVLAKVFTLEEGNRDKWAVRILNDPQTLALGQVVDVLIPTLIQNKFVDPLVPTWEKIDISIIQGRGLAAEDLNGKSDPYMKIYAGKNWKKKTKVKKETLSPKWNDANYELPYDNDLTEILFEVWDYDRIGKNEFLGKFTVNIAKLLPNQDICRWFRLEPRGKKSEFALGSIFVKLRKTATPSTSA